MDQSGQHNLSIALRHILQQIVDSTNPSGHKNTDMTLLHDGYIQRLSWFFECERCQYKAFYSQEMENHRMICGTFTDKKPFHKKRKGGLLKKATAVKMAAMEESDADSQPYPSPTAADYPNSTPSLFPEPTIASVKSIAADSSEPSTTTADRSAPLATEPTGVGLDTVESSPDFETPIITEHDDSAHKDLDFDISPSKDTPVTEARVVSQSERVDVYDPDILEIKVEVEGGGDTPAPPPLSSLNTPPASSIPDQVYSAGTADHSVDTMMSMFGSPPSLQTANNPPALRLSNPPALRPSSQSPMSSLPVSMPPLQTPSRMTGMFPSSTPQHSINKGQRKSYPMPNLSTSHLGGVRTPINRPSPVPSSASSAGSIQSATKKSNESYIDGGALSTHDDILLSYHSSAGPSHLAILFDETDASNSKSLVPRQMPGQRSHSMLAPKGKQQQIKNGSSSLTLEQKFRCCQLHDGGVAIKNLCAQFNQNKLVIQKVIQNKQKIMSEWFRYSNPYLQKRQRTLRTPAYAEINSAVLQWYWTSKAAGKSLTGVGIQTKAKAVAEELGYHSFKASNGWLEYFWKRVRRQEQATSGEMGGLL